MKFKTNKIETARKMYGMSRADLVREIQNSYPTCSNQIVYLWETKGVTPSPFYQDVLKAIFKDVDFYETRPARGMKTR